jgi:hypothetical protein
VTAKSREYVPSIGVFCWAFSNWRQRLLMPRWSWLTYI